MNYYLLDASSYVQAIIEKDKLYRFAYNFMEERKNGKAFLYIPQFCVTEVFKTFSKFYYFDKKIDENTMKELKETFREQIRERNKIYVYDLGTRTDTPDSSPS